MKKIAVLLFFASVLVALFVVPAHAKSYYIKISISQCRLWLYEQNGSGLDLLKEYSVGTVKKGLDKFPLGKGRVTSIEFNPTWRPTAYTKLYFATEKGINLPAEVPPGHKQNYMGAFRIRLSYNVPGKGIIYCIHGTRPEDDHLVGKRVSGGCVRMHNKEGTKLAKEISVGTTVNIVP